MKFRVQTLVIWLMWSWVVVATASVLAVATQTAHHLLSLVLLFPLSILLALFSKSIQYFIHASHHAKVLVGSTFLVVLSHLVQVFVPETGFDAVWYHLPVIDTLVNNGFIAESNLYQLLYPLWSDMLFVPGYVIASDFGTKLTAYAGMLTLLFVTYVLSRRFLSIKRSLTVVLLVSTFQVVSWQAASFYIDVFMAAFILAAFWRVIVVATHAPHERLSRLLAAAIWLGFAMGSKHFNLVLILPFAFAIWLHYQSFFAAIFGVVVSLVVASPWYVHAYLQTGQLLYPAFIHLNELTNTPEQGTASFILRRIVSFPISFITILVTRDYLSPILIVLLPALYLIRKKLHPPLLAILGLTLAEWVIWWFIPPFSTRYALAGFICAVILIAVWGSQLRNQTVFLTIWLLLALVVFLPRLSVNLRSFRYVFFQQSREQYLEQFFDGNADDKLKKWHALP